jgi:hypothetical protein
MRPDSPKAIYPESALVLPREIWSGDSDGQGAWKLSIRGLGDRQIDRSRISLSSAALLNRRLLVALLTWRGRVDSDGLFAIPRKCRYVV